MSLDNCSRKSTASPSAIVFTSFLVLLQVTRGDYSVASLGMERGYNRNGFSSSNFPPALVNIGNDDMDKSLKDILETCLLHKETRTILLAGEFENFLINHRKYFEFRKVALVGDSKYTAFKSFVLAKYSLRHRLNYNIARLLHKLHYFVVFASSVPNLQIAMQRIVESTWTNPDGFYILYAMDKYGCDGAFGFLWTAWEFDQTNVVYLCRDHAGAIAVYAYNPFSNMVPNSWEEVEEHKGRDGHPWILLRRSYEFGIGMCKNLYFDKTSTVNGYKVRVNAVVMEPFLMIDGDGTKLNNFHGENSKTLKTLWKKLNITPIISVYDQTHATMLTNVNGSDTPTGLFTDVANGKADMTMNFRYLVPRWGVRYTYPHAHGGLCVVTQNTGYVSELSKLLDFLSPQLVACIIAINLLTTFVLSRVGRQGWLRATLNTLRLFVCVAVIPPPRTNFGRIYLYTVIFSFVTINAIFQSHWSSILTLPVSKANVEDIEDLRKSEYALYGTSALKNIIGDTQLEDRFRPLKFTECKTIVLHDENAACLIDCRHALYRISEENLHHSSTIHELPEAYVTRPNWPLYIRVNQLIQNMVETGLISRWRWKDLRPYRQQFRKRQLLSAEGYRVLVLKRLEFIFYFLISGLLCSVLVFLIEVTTDKRLYTFFAKKTIKAKSKYATFNNIKLQKRRQVLPWVP